MLREASRWKSLTQADLLYDDLYINTVPILNLLFGWHISVWVLFMFLLRLCGFPPAVRSIGVSEGCARVSVALW